MNTARGGKVTPGTAEAKAPRPEQSRPGKAIQNASEQVGVLAVPISQKGKLKLSNVECPSPQQWQIRDFQLSLSEIACPLGTLGGPRVWGRAAG